MIFYFVSTVCKHITIAAIFPTNADINKPHSLNSLTIAVIALAINSKRKHIENICVALLSSHGAINAANIRAQVVAIKLAGSSMIIHLIIRGSALVVKIAGMKVRIALLITFINMYIAANAANAAIHLSIFMATIHQFVFVLIF